MTDRTGQQLGNYRLARLLGEGGFAEVYLGEHLFLGTATAIKVLHTQVAPEDMALFQQEARILAGLKHPHIVNILDFGIEERTPYLIMSYAPHGTLRTRHPKGTVLPIATVVEYVKQVAQALQYAHERKIVHRDIKPENMLIGEQNEVLLSDFGIALIAQSSRYQKTTDMVGTIAYMAPEQIAGHPRTASDQYSLGVIAYEWLCGMRPFQGSFTEIAIQHSVTPPPSPREHLSTLSPDIEYVVLTALAKQPEERFASVSAFATALEQASQDLLPTERLHPLNTPSPLYTTSPLADAVIPSNTTAEMLTSPLHSKLSISYTTKNHQSVPVPASTTKNPPDLPTSAKTIEKPIISRRKVLRRILLGATGGAAIATFGVSIFVISQQHPPGQVPIMSSPTKGTPVL
jgi:serine/threonine protein kinase